MAKYILSYNFDQWVELMATLGEFKPPCNCGPGSNIAITVELDGARKEKEEEMGVKGTLKRYNGDNMVQAQLARIEKKLFTERENRDFLLGLVKDMVADTQNW